MARRSWSNCPRVERRLLIALAAGLLAACSNAPVQGPVMVHARGAGEDAATAELIALREHLAQPASKRLAERERLRVAAERGDRAAELRYMLMLSLVQDDAAELRLARDYFGAQLAAPDPLPIALDALLRLQLGQVNRRLEHLEARQRSAAACGHERLQRCETALAESERRREDMRQQLSEVRRKLDALARIEQTVNQQQEQQDARDAPEIREEKENDAEQGTDPAGR